MTKESRCLSHARIGKEPTDTCTSVSEDVSIVVTKCHNGGRFVESICEEKCNITAGEPKPPGSLQVDQCQTNEDGTHMLVGEKKVPLIGTNEAR